MSLNLYLLQLTLLYVSAYVCAFNKLLKENYHLTASKNCLSPCLIGLHPNLYVSSPLARDKLVVVRACRVSFAVVKCALSAVAVAAMSGAVLFADKQPHQTFHSQTHSCSEIQSHHDKINSRSGVDNKSHDLLALATSPFLCRTSTNKPVDGGERMEKHYSSSLQFTLISHAHTHKEPSFLQKSIYGQLLASSEACV